MPLFRRFGRPGLLGAVTRTAVVAGTAAMTDRAINRSMDDRTRIRAEAERYEAHQDVRYEPTQTQPIAPVETLTSQLATLSSLNSSGAITDEEFARAKQRVLGG